MEMGMKLYLRSHPVWGAHKGIGGAFNGRAAKVGQFDCPILR